MSLFIVDKTKCVNCGICAADCPIGIIRMGSSGKFPEPVENAPELCINCGHCSAVCPEGALSLDSLGLEKFRALPDNWGLSPEQVENFLKGRRSIRVYKKDKVERRILEKVIDIARYAPSGINLQPVRWLVIQESAKVRQLAGLTIEMSRSLVRDNSALARNFRLNDLVSAWDKGEDRVCRNAPHLVIAYGLKDDTTAPTAATIALTYFELAAASFGLGTCWAGYLNMALNTHEPARAAVKISQRCGFLGALMVGYPEFKYRLIPPRKEPNIKWE